ncbi:site-2 protease family protein [Shewanella surugensis]|uniref:Site-2 protease family protein n=1 Tax=Shewanella surugensis TaxID=212020 RepID=A0ABT0L8N5_9GAMM|nr:site-2 protease family protein [Shewanella surugensis]MCL1124058.1 site-2 protease family protein [Shewanella surugensis]
MELINIDCLGKPLRLEGSMAGWQQLFWGESLVSVIDASADNEGKKTHAFELSVQTASQATPSIEPPLPQKIQITLETDLSWQPFSIHYRLLKNEVLLTEGSRDTKDIERQVPLKPVKAKKPFSIIGLASLGFKLLKSAKIIKVVLAGASIAAYSWLFSFQFAIALIACLVFHEYGHIRAMKYFGMKTKGIYLIPFMGGLALSDEKINTRWQDVVISIMGPTFGLFMSIISLILYWVTGNIFFAGLAAFNALLNLFNLLPILPLDGGHILKSISFSMNSVAGLVACVLGAAIGIYISYTLGLALLGFLLLIGSAEIIFEWKTRHQSHLLPLDRYGQLFSTLWYFVTVGLFIAIIWYFAGTGDSMLGLPLKILQS